MKKVCLFNIILIIILIFSNLIYCKSTKKNKKKVKKIIQEENSDVISSILEWAKNNNIYINNKLILNQKKNADQYYYFSADNKIPNNTLLLKVPYDIMISQFSLNEIYKGSKNKKFENLWNKILNIKSEYIKYFSTKQLVYISTIVENAIRKKRGPIYKKYKDYFRMYEKMNFDNFPIFYDEQEKFYLSGSNFGAQLIRASESLNEEYFILTRELNISIPFQDDYLKTRVISLISSIDFHDLNLNYSNEYNETVIVPFLDCFNKAISEEKANARFVINGIKNETNNYTNYYLEVYSKEEIFIGGEITIKWRPFPNSELLLYYGIVEEGNPLKSRYYIDIMNRKLKNDLGIPEDKIFENVKRDIYEITTEFYDPSVINTYRNISINLDKYKDREEGAYELMLDNLKNFAELYDNPLSDGNINIYINGKDKIKNIKEIMHMEKKIIAGKIKYLEKVIKGIKEKNNNNEEKYESEDDL